MAKEQDVVSLPFKIREFNEDMIIALDRNFKEIEDRLSALQLNMKTISGGSVGDIVNSILIIKENALAALSDAATAQETADGQIQGFFQNDAPTENMHFGDIWIDTDGHTPPTVADIYRYEDVDHGSGGEYAWRVASTNAIGKIYLNAYLAQATADSKIKTYYQATAPTAETDKLTEGDFWVDTSDKNRLYRWDGTVWADARDTSASGVGMGVDDNCTGLWHFDGSLNSHKGTVAVFDGSFANSKWGQGLSVVANKTLKIPTTDIIDPAETSINMLVYDLSSSSNGSVIFDLGDSDGNQAIKVGIAPDGKLYVEDNKVEYTKAETSQADFNTGTLTDVQSNPTGDLTLKAEGFNLAAVEDTQAEFEAGVLTNLEYASGLKLKYTPGETTYGTDFTGGKTYSADSIYDSAHSAGKAFDNNTATFWQTYSYVYPHWIKVDLGSGVTKTAMKLRIYKDNADRLKTFKLQDSNNDTDWTDIYPDVAPQSTGWFEYTFDNSTACRYYRIYGTDSYEASTYMRIAEIELMEATETPGTYALSGTWEKEYDLSAVGVARGSLLSWSATTPANTSIQVQAAIALDGVNYGSYANCTSGNAIPGITAGMDLSSAKVKIKVTETTTDNTVTPSLDSLALSVTSAYKTSGNRVHIYDISGVGIAEVSQIAWDATLPTGTSLAVKAAISTDGGATYGALQSCTSGQAIPVLTANMAISNARLKIQEDLATTDYSATPKLNSLNFSVSKEANIAYGTNKSTLTGWDNIAIQWKTERLSLIINGAESAYIENPGQVTTLATYAYIGSDKAGANQIGTVVDELRIDKIYQPVEKVNAWHIVDAPFYTSEEFKQWPGYVKVETDGLKVYDSENVLRVLVGSWIKDAIRKHGIKIIDGEIYSSLISTADEGAQNFIRLNPPYNLEVYGAFGDNPAAKQLVISAAGGGGGIWFYNDGVQVAQFGAGAEDKLYLFTLKNKFVVSSYGGMDVIGGLNVSGGTKNCVDPTENYGFRAMSAVESPEILFYDRGRANLVNGEATVHFDPIYLEMIEPDTDLTPWLFKTEVYGLGESIRVIEWGDNYFKVKEENSGTSNRKFGWWHEATRKNYAGIRLMEVVK